MGRAVRWAPWGGPAGRESLRRVPAGESGRPPLSSLTGLRLTEAGPGTATFVLPAHGWLGSPSGNIEGGFTAMLADAALRSAIQTTAPAGGAVASMDLKGNFLRPVVPDGQELVGLRTAI